jgi:hypothetical protein
MQGFLLQFIRYLFLPSIKEDKDKEKEKTKGGSLV